MRHKINSKLRRSFEAHEVLPNKNREGNVLFFKVKKAILPPSDYDDHYMGDWDNTTADLKIRHNMTTQHKTRILISCLHDSSVRSPRTLVPLEAQKILALKRSTTPRPDSLLATFSFVFLEIGSLSH